MMVEKTRAGEFQWLKMDHLAAGLMGTVCNGRGHAQSLDYVKPGLHFSDSAARVSGPASHFQIHYNF